jgi:hypothetical protein
VVFAVLMAGCVLFGLLVGRWSALLAALPFGVLMGALSDPWEVSKFHCGVVWAVAGIVGIALGVTLRKLAGIFGSGEEKQARVS